MQETGSNIPVNDKKLSIRLVLNGQSFSLQGLNLKSSVQDADAMIEIDSANTIIMPNDDRVDAKDVMTTLRQKSSNFNTIVIEHDSFKIAVAVPTEAIKAINDRVTGKIAYTSPLIGVVDLVAKAVEERSERVALCFTGRNLYVAVGNKAGLVYAEALECTGDEQLGYYLAVLDKDFDIEHSEIVVIDHNANRSNYKHIKKHFSHVKCV